MRKHNGRIGLVAILLIAILALPISAAMLSMTIEVFPGISIFIDGVELNPTDVNGKKLDVFVYEGTTYVPLRAVSQSLGKDVSYEANSKSVYIGKNTGGTKYLMDVCPPYEKNYYFGKEKSWVMAGHSYANGFTMIVSGASAYWNLDGKYEKISFDFGHVDGTPMLGGKFTIYLDGVVKCVIEANSNELPTHYELDLAGAKQMVISSDYSISDPKYGFANIVVE